MAEREREKKCLSLSKSHLEFESIYSSSGEWTVRSFFNASVISAALFLLNFLIRLFCSNVFYAYTHLSFIVVYV